MKKFIILIIILLLFGCTTSKERREHALKFGTEVLFQLDDRNIAPDCIVVKDGTNIRILFIKADNTIFSWYTINCNEIE